MDSDYLECIYRMMFHVKYCKNQQNSIMGWMYMEALKKFFINSTLIVIFLTYITDI